LEMLLGIVLITAIVSVSASSFESLKRQDGTHEAALEFAQLVREARDMARRTSSPVRLTLSTPALAKKLTAYRLTEADLRPGCGVFLFTVPAHRLEPVALIQPTAPHEADSALRETVPLTRLPLPRSLIGGWTPAPGHGSWHEWREHIHIGGPLMESYLEQEFEDFSRIYLYRPESTWAQERSPQDPSRHPFSIYPAAMSRSPYRRAAEPRVAPLREEDTVRLDDGTQLSALEVWGSAPVLQWGDLDASTFPPMPALDFTAEGRLAYAQQPTLEVHFRPGPGRTPVYKVIIRARDGEVHLE
jgi:hypothetical protein